ncbi:Septin spn4, partial [Coemansia asiatica]
MSATDANGLASAQSASGGIGIANLPNQLHKIVTKKGTNFSLMVVGESGTGKTTFINTLLTTEIIEPLEDAARRKKQLDKTVDINIHKAELEEKMFNVKLNVVDTPGFGDFVNNIDCWLPVVDFIENQYEQYLRQEQQPVRKGIVDMRVHACLYFIRPNGHTISSTSNVSSRNSISSIKRAVHVCHYTPASALVVGPPTLVRHIKMAAVCLHSP